MEPSSSSSYSRRQLYSEKFLSKRIAPAIVGKSCPICLNHIDYRRSAVITVCLHAYCIDCIQKWSNMKRNCPLCNSFFDSWFFKISLSSRSFHKLQLPALNNLKKVNSEDLYGRRSCRLNFQSVIRRSRKEFNVLNGRTRPLRRRRSFGQARSVPPDIIRDRVLQWRASIYERRLQAVPCSMRNFCEQSEIAKSGVKERILQKIEPWIRRELQAITGDPDPSIIVHVGTTLFISSLEEKRKVSSGHSGPEDNYLEPLRPFLLERTSMFWHELRCFAESSFNMDTYDTVVEYIIMHTD